MKNKKHFTLIELLVVIATKTRPAIIPIVITHTTVTKAEASVTVSPDLSPKASSAVLAAIVS